MERQRETQREERGRERREGKREERGREKQRKKREKEKREGGLKTEGRELRRNLKLWGQRVQGLDCRLSSVQVPSRAILSNLG